MKIPLVKSAIPYLALSALAAVGGFLVCPAAGALAVVAGAGFAFFFRDPVRAVVCAPECVLSPADGTVMAVERCVHDPYLNGNTVIVRIFLSLFDAQIQRVPLDGGVLSVSYTKGKFRPAFSKGAERDNTRNVVIMEHKAPSIHMAVVQIAGSIARRIECWVKEGQHLHTGQRIGMIRFGSQVDVHLPSAVTVTIKPGERLKAGITQIGIIAK